MPVRCPETGRPGCLSRYLVPATEHTTLLHSGMQGGNSGILLAAFRVTSLGAMVLGSVRGARPRRMCTRGVEPRARVETGSLVLVLDVLIWVDASVHRCAMVGTCDRHSRRLPSVQVNGVNKAAALCSH